MRGEICTARCGSERPRRSASVVRRGLGSTLQRWDPKRGVRPARWRRRSEAARHRISMALAFGLVLSVRIVDRICGYLHREESRGVDLE